MNERFKKNAITYIHTNTCGDTMKRFTVNIPKELKEKLDSMPEINWPEIAKQGIMKKLESLERFEQTEQRGA